MKKLGYIKRVVVGVVDNRFSNIFYASSMSVTTKEKNPLLIEANMYGPQDV